MQGPVEALPYEKLMECTHCGLCLPSCPTYRELGVEMDSPRGRIYLVRALEDARAAVTPRLALHLDLCVGCRACETACPSGVSFGRILEHGRSRLGGGRGPFPRLQDALYRRLLPRKRRLAVLARLAAFVQRTPLRRILARLREGDVLPAEVRHALDVMTTIPARPPRPLPDEAPALGPRQGTAGLLICCMMRVLLTEVNEATVRVLQRYGNRVRTPSMQECCGALHAHAGRLEEARDLAKVNIAAFEGADVDVVVTNSAGCGAHMKEYPHLFAGDPAWEARARRFSEKVRDVAEHLASLPPPKLGGTFPLRVAYDDPCHLLHGQGIREEPRSLLRGVPGLDFVEMKEPDWCCGSAGTYMLTQPEMARRLLRRKLEDIRGTGAQVVATGNPGCLLWLRWGLAREGLSAQALHPIQILDMALGSPGEVRPAEAL